MCPFCLSICWSWMNLNSLLKWTSVGEILARSDEMGHLARSYTRSLCRRTRGPRPVKSNAHENVRSEWPTWYQEPMQSNARFSTGVTEHAQKRTRHKYKISTDEVIGRPLDQEPYQELMRTNARSTTGVTERALKRERHT